MGRSVKELRRSLAPITGVPTSDTALISNAIGGASQTPLRQKVKEETQQLSKGLPRGPLKS